MYFIEAVLHIRTRMSLGRAIYCEATYYGILEEHWRLVAR